MPLKGPAQEADFFSQWETFQINFYDAFGQHGFLRIIDLNINHHMMPGISCFNRPAYAWLEVKIIINFDILASGSDGKAFVINNAKFRTGLPVQGDFLKLPWKGRVEWKL